MINNIYNYYASLYGQRQYSKYDTHTKSQLKTTSNKVSKINSKTPDYKLDTSEDAIKYAIDLKENARELGSIAEQLSDGNSDSFAYKRSASSDNEEVVSAVYTGNSNNSENSDLNVQVSQLASSQINTGNFLQPNKRILEPGDYSFDLSINNLTYEFEFNVDESESSKDIQEKISRLINRSNIGLSSDILTDNLGNTAICIQSDATGITGIKPTIFNIKISDNTDAAAAIRKNELVSTLGLDRVSQFPANAVFKVNGKEMTSPSNEVNINNTFSLTLLNTTNGNDVNITLNTDSDAIADGISDLVSGYNRLLSITSVDSNSKFEGNQKLQKDFRAMTKSYKDLLSTNGLSITDDGTISVDKEAVKSAADNGSINDIFKNLNNFKHAIQKKAEDISLDPMNYVNNKIIAYKNPTRILNDPYNLSAYSGMIFNGYI